jgi:hypothetical protein
MQAKLKKDYRFNRATFFSGVEFTRDGWRPVPAGFEEAARANELLEVREGTAEKEIVKKQADEKEKHVMKARLAADYKDPTLRTFGAHEYNKTEWLPVPAGYEASARAHELLEIWEAGAPEPTQENKKEASRPAARKRTKFADTGSEE